MKPPHRFLLPFTLIAVAAVAVRAQDIDDFVKGWMESQHVPGVSIAVIKDGSLIKAEGYGLADVEHRIPARPDTVFKIGSVSKQFIAAGIMLLVQDGRLAVDDKISKYMEGTPTTWEAITLRHLLTHTSGFGRQLGAGYPSIASAMAISRWHSRYGVSGSDGGSSGRRARSHDSSGS
jgi:D-alanyl-D-alanine carboxypeptidase